MEDLNHLLHREQEELLLAAKTCNGARRTAHMDVASGYAARIRAHRLPYRTPSATGAVRFNPGRFGASGRPTLSLFKGNAK